MNAFKTDLQSSFSKVKVYICKEQTYAQWRQFKHVCCVEQIMWRSGIKLSIMFLRNIFSASEKTVFGFTLVFSFFFCFVFVVWQKKNFMLDSSWGRGPIAISNYRNWEANSPVDNYFHYKIKLLIALIFILDHSVEKRELMWEAINTGHLAMRREVKESFFFSPFSDFMWSNVRKSP